MTPETDDLERLRENFWRTVKKAARHVPFMEDVVADIRRTYRGSLRIAHDLMRIDL